MNQKQTDTRATAYLFGELLPEEAIAFERDLEQSPELQREVDALRDAIGALRSEFQSTAEDISPAHRQAIDRAIEQASLEKNPVDTPVPPPIVLETGEASARRWLVPAAIAATLLFAFGLTFPSLLGPDGSRVSQSIPDGFSTHLNPTSLQSFNLAIREQRFDDADAIANQYAKDHGDDPLSDTLLQTSKLARSMAGASQGLEQVELDVDEEAMLEFSTSDADVALQLADDVEANVTDGVNEATLMMSDDLAVNPKPLPETVEIGDLEEETLPMNAGLVAQSQVDRNQTAPPSSIPESNDSLQVSKQSRRNADLDFGFRPQTSATNDGYVAGGRPNNSSNRKPARSRRSRRDMAGMGDMMDEMMTGGMMGVGNVEPDAMQAMGMGGMAMSMEGEPLGMEAEMSMDGMMGMDEMGMVDMMGMGFGGGGDRFEPIVDNEFLKVSRSPLSTFSIDVDTASYAKVRSMLQRHSLPSPDSVRIEEMLNYFHYDYPTPNDDHPFSASMEIASCPWNPDHRLARIGIKGREIETDRPSSNLVFLLDVSGSMDEPNKLPLVVDGMKMLTEQLSENDKVAIVVYAGAAGLVLESTRGDKKQVIMSALSRLKAGGSTNGGQGIALAYDVARDNFVVGGTNRVILCSDGDFNVGVTGTDALVTLAKENAKSNVFLSILGFGTGNHNDAMMEQVSNDANGNYAFIDNAAEAKKVLIEELGGTLVTIAKDVKIQVEFNPREVESYRLIGYENRVLEDEDFNNDLVDAGEIGAGHTVTALYEVVPKKAEKVKASPKVDPLRYQEPARLSHAAEGGEMLALKLRYKEPEGLTSTLIQFPVSDTGKSFRETDRDFKFAASVAAFGMLLRHSPYAGTASMERVLTMAREGAVGDDFGYRTEFLALVERAEQLTSR